MSDVVLWQRAQRVIGASCDIEGLRDLLDPEVLRGRDVTSLAGMLEQMHRTILDLLPAADGGSESLRLLTAAVELAEVLAAVRRWEFDHQAARVGQLAMALEGLRVVDRVTDLERAIPYALAQIGFGSSMVSKVNGSTWTGSAGISFGRNSLVAEEEMLAIAAQPGRVGWESPETKSVLERTPVLVTDVTEEYPVHRYIVDNYGICDYVVAPVVVRGAVVALVHANRPVGRRHVTAHDADLVGAFAQGLGGCFEIAMMSTQLARMRGALLEHAAELGNLVHGDVSDAPPPQHTAAARRRLLLTRQESGPLQELTRRELDVMLLVAEHKTNAEIGAALFVSAGTVKTHVQNAMRKLGATRRIEAAERLNQLLDAIAE